MVTTAMGKFSIITLLRTIAALPESMFSRKVKTSFLYLEVTHHCNLKCVACYTGARLEKKDALNLAEQKSTIRQAKEMGVKTVSLSGSGEPLLYKNLFEQLPCQTLYQSYCQ